MCNITCLRRALLLCILLALSAAPKWAADPPNTALRDSKPEDLFALRMVTPPPFNFAGSSFPIVFQAYRPYGYDPLEGLHLDISVAFEDEDEIVDEASYQLITDTHGEARLALPLVAIRQGELSIAVSVEATHRGFTRRLEDTFNTNRAPRAVVSTDRTLYQPGQTVHMRGLWLDSKGKPMDREVVQWTISDEPGRTVAQVERTTSEMGIASFDWPIPPTLRSGYYSIDVTPNTAGYGTTLHILPYEPATLLLEVEPLREVLLPDDPAEVAITVRRPNGDPVVGASIETFMAGDPRHDEPFATSLSRSPVVKTDADGRALATLDLSGDFEELYFPSNDFHLHARATDPVSGLAESVNFHLRLSQHPIHLYAVGRLSPSTPRHTPAERELPSKTFVFAQQANGEPVSTWVEIRRERPDDSMEVLGRMQTNPLGVATLENFSFDADDAIHLVALAADQEGALELGNTQAYWEEHEGVVMTVDRPLLDVGEPLSLTVHVATPSKRLHIGVWGQGHLLAERFISQLDDSLSVSFPYQDDFIGPLFLRAVLLDPEHADHWQLPGDQSIALYPSAAEPSRLSITSDRQLYRPGDTAFLNVRQPDSPGQTAVAVAVVDRATEARQASDGLGPGSALLDPLNFVPWHESNGLEIGGWSIPRLQQLTPEERSSSAAQLVAQGLPANLYETSLEDATSDPLRNARQELEAFFTAHSSALEPALRKLEKDAPEDVIDAQSFVAEFHERGVDLQGMADPWGQPFRVTSGFIGASRIFDIYSNGWDKTPNTADDFEVWSVSWRFAQSLAKRLHKVASEALRQDGKLLKNEADVADALLARGIRWQEQRDPWGQPYYLHWNSTSYGLDLQLRSAGPDRQIADEPWPSYLSDDITIDTIRLPLGLYFEDILRRIMQDATWDDILPCDGATFLKHLRRRLDDSVRWKDLRGHDLFFTVTQRTAFVDAWKKDDKGRSTPFPTRQVSDLIELWGSGPDLLESTDDDILLVTIGHPRSDVSPVPLALTENLVRSLPEGSGLLAGAIIFADGSTIPGALVTVRAAHGPGNWTAITDVDGAFRLPLAAGRYSISADLEGFKRTLYPLAQVQEGALTPVTLQLEIEAVHEETLIVTAASPTLLSIETDDVTPPAKPVSTPRLRRDFPETLFWLAEGRTDEEGRLRLDVPLADSITTWHVAALASNAEGRISSAEHDLVVDQPFFLQPDLPPLLTVGDAIALPVDVHNKTGQIQSSQLTLHQERPDGSTSPDVHLEKPLAEGVSRFSQWQDFTQAGETRLRWTAALDAIEETTHVVPDGALHLNIQNRWIQGRENLPVTLPLALPESALPGSGQIEIVLYEGVQDHLLDALKGLAKQPTGCGEQTTAIAWLNLLLLDHLTASGQDDSEAAIKARQHLRIAQQSLDPFRRDGGFAYWHGSPEADPALTAFVLEFLLALDHQIEVDDDWIDDAAQFLCLEQQEEGNWATPKTVLPIHTEIRLLRSLRTDALLARSLAQHAVSEGDEESRQAAQRALLHLDAKVGEDPYALALMTQAAAQLGGTEAIAIARQGAQRLRRLARPSEGDLYWQLRANTPFHSWGRSAQLETTSLAIKALAAAQMTWPADTSQYASLETEMAAGLSFLLLNKDVDGTWGTTQASLRVLSSLTSLLPAAGSVGSDDSNDGRLSAEPRQPQLDGQPLAKSTEISSEGTPRRWILPLSAGAHQLSLEADPLGSGQLLQVRTRSYLPWDDPQAQQESPELDFEVACRSELTVGETTACQVTIARTGYRGTGMLIAEIGLPPGAEVDDAALRQAVQKNTIQSFEEWPGRLVLYVWPRAEGLQLQLPWRPRLALRAKSQPSALYDYYNPDERVVLRPANFVVREGAAPIESQE